MPTRVLGVDPGFASLGYAVVDLDDVSETPLCMGVVETKKNNRKQKVLACEDNFVRAQELIRQVHALVTSYDVKAICAEAMSFPRNASTAAKMALAWGAMAALCDYESMPMVQATPQQIKKVVASKRTASKTDIQDALVNRYPEVDRMLDNLAKTKREHAADALGAVVAALDSDVIRMVRKLGK